MASQSNGLNVLHSFIIDEMRKKETVLEQVLDQTKSIRMGFENFQRSMETKSQEISVLRKSVSEMREEVNVLKSQVDEVGSRVTSEDEVGAMGHQEQREYMGAVDGGRSPRGRL